MSYPHRSTPKGEKERTRSRMNLEKTKTSLSSRSSFGRLSSFISLDELKRKALEAHRLKMEHGIRITPKKSLRVFAKAAIVFMRRAKSLKLENRQDEEAFAPYLEALQGLVLKNYSEGDEVVFRKDLFKPNKELLVLPKKAIRILTSRVRTEEDVVFLCRCLRVLRRFNEYPESVQEKIVRKLIYQKFEAKRILLREGHKPEGMYFVVSGTAVEFSLTGFTARPSFLAEQGDIFGETSLVAGTPRPKTWISQTPVTLLYLRSDDYFSIFNIGNQLRKPSQNEEETESSLYEFLRTIKWFQTWPLHLLQNNRTKNTFRMYKKGEIIEEHARSASWLYVVVSGSISVIKKLKKPIPRDFDDEHSMYIIGGSRHGLINLDYTRQIGIHEEWFDRLYLEFEMFMKHSYLRADQRLSNRRPTSLQELLLLMEDETASDLPLEQENIEAMKAQALVELDAEGNDDETGQNKNQPSLGQLNLAMMLSVLRKNRKDQVENDSVSYDQESSTTRDVSASTRGGSGKSATSWPGFSRETTSAAAFLRSRKNTQGTSKLSSYLPPITEDDSTQQVVIEIEKLESGELFGGGYLVHENQPDLTLMTTNGCELFLIDRELFRKNASDILLCDMVKGISSYPSDKQLQYRLQTFADWKQYRHDVMNNAIENSGIVSKSVPELPQMKIK